MSEDIREMVELAAVALGLKGRALERMEKRGHYVYSVSNGFERTRYDWLGDDGDSARMRSALMIGVQWQRILATNNICAVNCYAHRLDSYPSRTESLSDHDGDRNAALRMASLKVAAEIGRKMKESSNG